MTRSTFQTLRHNLAEPPSPADVASVTKVTPFGTATTVVNATVFTLVRWDSLGGTELAAWFTATLAFCLYVFLKSWRIRNVSVERVSRRAARHLVLTSFLLALPWAVLAIGVLPRGNEYDQLFTLVVCIGMSFGAGLMLQRTLAAMLVFLVTVISGIIGGSVLAQIPGAYALVIYGTISGSWVALSAFLSGETARERDSMVTWLSDANRELEDANRKISSFAYVDALTGLPSRKAFSEAIEQDIEKAQREGRRYSVLMFDLDNFKNVNDSFGHQVGDELLTITGQRISRLLDAQSMVARLGGDEYAVLAPLDESHEPEHLAAALIEAVTETATIGERHLVPGTSVGIAILPDHASSSTELLRNADAALRQAKEMGKGRVAVYDAKLGRALDEASMVASELKTALDNDGLDVHYQPKIDLNSGAIRGVEALLRWSHPRLGQVAPDRFLPIAHEHGLIQSVSAFVYRRVAEDVSAWRQAGVEFGKVAVNIHPVDLKAPEHLFKTIRSIAESHAVGPGDLVLEITEGCFTGRGTEATPKVLNEISRQGYELSLDDFGTGYAALTHLLSLPVREIKIDKSFVWSMERSKGARAIVSAVLAAAKGTGLRTVAEGIETQKQLEMLRELGADCGQGFFWSQALPADELAAFVCGMQADRGHIDELRALLSEPMKLAANP